MINWFVSVPFTNGYFPKLFGRKNGSMWYGQNMFETGFAPVLNNVLHLFGTTLGCLYIQPYIQRFRPWKNWVLVIQFAIRKFSLFNLHLLSRIYNICIILHFRFRLYFRELEHRFGSPNKLFGVLLQFVKIIVSWEIDATHP